MMTIQSEPLIRKATEADIAAIRSLAEQIWPAAYAAILSDDQITYMLELFYSPAALLEQMTVQQHQFLLVETGGEHIGFASYSGASEPGIFKLHKIYVKPKLQGNGVGKALIEFILAEVLAKDGTALQLNVNRQNRAKTFYEKIGFTVIDEVDINIGNGYWMNDYVMELELKKG